jgi:hypothetical protein
MLFGSCEEPNSCGPPTESEQNGNVPRRRLAVALLFEERVALELLTLRSAVGSPSFDRVPPHITLIPPINVPASQMDAVMALLRQSAGVIRAFKARIGPVETCSLSRREQSRRRDPTSPRTTLYRSIRSGPDLSVRAACDASRSDVRGGTGGFALGAEVLQSSSHLSRGRLVGRGIRSRMADYCACPISSRCRVTLVRRISVETSPG